MVQERAAPLDALRRLSLRRLAAVPALLLLANAFGYLYASLARWVRASDASSFSAFLKETVAAYWVYLQGVARLDFGTLPHGRGPASEAVLSVLPNSLGLLALAFLISSVLGLVLGLQSARTNPPSVNPWLTPVSTLGMAMPSFYVGTLSFTLLIFFILRGWPRPSLPFFGTGWDRHLVLPLVALCLRPTAQIALISARLLADELRKPYVTAARSAGQTWFRIRWRSALRNIAAPVTIALLASLRLLIGELLVVEWVFQWRGVGRLLAEAFIPPRLTTEQARALFLDPVLVAFLLMVVTLLFLLTDLAGRLLIPRLDPRLRAAEG
ncbi:MAG TPA: ABC transporter permease [Ardenticatenaceae bacterium]|jgi:ABC-type dipeptide/oligopeptide/nickel transport system permease component